MNYYEHHLGDYAEATSHLSFAEDAAYSRLLRKYYATDKPIPGDIKAVQRLTGARTRTEKKAVETVLREFFFYFEGFWHNKRCDLEIARFQDKQTKAKRSADARWKAVKPDDPPMQTDSERNANAMRTHSEGNAHQTPDSKLQAPDLKTEGEHTEVLTPMSKNLDKKIPCGSSLPGQKKPPPEYIPKATAAGACCKSMAKHGVQACNPTHPTLLALIKAGATELEFAAATKDAVGRGKPHFSYVIGIVKRQREEAANLVLHQGRMPNRQEALEASNRAATEGWKPPEMREKNHAI